MEWYECSLLRVLLEDLVVLGQDAVDDVSDPT